MLRSYVRGSLLFAICVFLSGSVYAQGHDHTDSEETNIEALEQKYYEETIQQVNRRKASQDARHSHEAYLQDDEDKDKEKKSKKLENEPCPIACFDPNLFFSAKAAYFHPTDSLIQRIYSNNMGIYGVEMSWREWKELFAWVSVSYLHHSGHSIGRNNPTEVDLVPLGFGLEYLKSFRHFDFYLGIGALYSYIHFRDHSPFVIPSVTKWDWGGTAKIGLRFFFKQNFFLDLFSDYSYMKFFFHNGRARVVRQDVNFSGLSIGASIGYAL